MEQGRVGWVTVDTHGVYDGRSGLVIMEKGPTCGHPLKFRVVG